MCACRGKAGESIDPTAFNGSFKAQLAVQRTSNCTPAPLSKIQDMVRFYKPGRFQQSLTAQQVAALSSVLSLKPVRTSPPALQGKAETAKPSKATMLQPVPAEQPSASCRVTQPAPAKTTSQSSGPTQDKVVASGSTQSAALEKAPMTSAAVKSKDAMGPAKSSGSSQPLAFQIGLKGKAGSAAGGGGAQEEDVSRCSPGRCV